MLDNYEQKKLLEYLLEGLSKIKTKINGRNNSNYSRCLEETSDAINDAYEDGRLDIELHFSDENGDNTTLQSHEFHKKRVSCYKQMVEQLINKYKKLQHVKISNREKTLRVLKEIFHLNDEQFNILSLIARNEVSETFSDCLCLVRERYGQADSYNMCKAYLKNTSTIHDSIHKLRDCGLVTSDGYRGSNIGLPKLIYDIVGECSKISKEEIIEAVMGKQSVATLKKSDFAHLKDEFNMVQLILKNALKDNSKGINILLYGEVGTGKTEFAKTLVRCLRTSLHETIYEDKRQEETCRTERLNDLMRKMTICKNLEQKQLILFDEAEDVFTACSYGNNSISSKAFMNRMLENNAVPVIWTTNNIRTMDKAYLRRFTYSIKFEELSDEVQLKFMKKEFAKNDFEISDDEIVRLSKKYDLSSAVITNSIKLVKLTNSKNDKFEDFVKNQTTLLNRGMEKSENFNVNKKSESYNFNLVNTDTDVHKLLESIKKTEKFNFSLCLYGEAGTGKSEYAKQLADRLGFEVIFKRASDLMSKWVGETEQNIARAFKEARDKKAILIFDEADSLLQSRGSASRSWEISQVNEMLTWMESHPYPFICTTNFMDSLDEASLRRFTFKIKFKYMTNEQVKLGFKHFFDKDVDEEVANIKGLTAGDFATVKKKISFLGTDDVSELKALLQKEVEVKKSKELSSNVGF